ncbi:MAG TPA: CHAT domain-containing protein [Candidatus Angelobacter sp.]
MNTRLAISIVLLLAVSLPANAVPMEDSTQGIIVEEVTKGSAGELAGLLPGDVIRSWRRDGAETTVESPFDLLSVELEQAPLGTVVLKGLRGAERKSWELGPGAWSLKIRPNLPPGPLYLYQEGWKLAATGKGLEAAEHWQKMAKAVDPTGTVWLVPWLWARSAELLAQSHEWKNADEAYANAIQEAAGSPLVRSQLLSQWAATFEERNDWAGADKYYHESLLENQKLHSEGLAVAVELQNLGRLAWKRGELTKAEDYYRRALTMIEARAPESLPAASSLNWLGNVAWRRGELEKAKDLHQHALAIRKKLAPNSLDVAASLSNLGNIYYTQGDLDQVERLCLEVIAIQEKLAPDSLVLAGSFNNLGAIAWERFDLANAERYHRRALEIRERLAPGSPDVADSLTNMGLVLSRRGELQQAQDYYQKALRIQERLAPGSLALAELLNNLASLALELGHAAMAEVYDRRAFAIREKLAPSSPDFASSLYNLAEAARRAGKLEQAEHYCRRALAIEDGSVPSSLLAAGSLGQLGLILQARGDMKGAEDAYRKALALQEKLAPGTVYTADSLGALASLLQQRGELQGAAELFDRSVRALESQTAHLGGAEQVRSGFRARRGELYSNYVDLLVTLQQPEAAFHIAEESRARSLLEMLTAAHVDIRTGLNPMLLEKERSSRQALDEATNRWVHALNLENNAQLAAGIKNTTETLLQRYEQVEAEIRSASPAYAALTQPQPLHMQQAQSLLDGDTFLLEYALGERHSYLFLVSHTSLAVYSLPPRKQIESLAAKLYRALKSREGANQGRSGSTPDLQRTALALSRMVLGPVVSRLENKRLLISAEGALQYIPFAVLPVPGTVKTPLLLEHEIAYLPSASVLAILREQELGRKEPPKAVAVFADPVFDVDDPRVRPGMKTAEKDHAPANGARKVSQVRGSARSSDDAVWGYLPRLPFSLREARSIMAVTPADLRMEALGFDASRARATDPELAQYRIVHFATHGLINNSHPELSGLVLSMEDRQGRPQNGFLKLQDIYNLNLPVDLVVLSACKTGLGQAIRGEGLQGLTRGFMYAGASRIVASLWNADDVATAELMAKFYWAMEREGLRPAAALRQAQIQMLRRKRWTSPYYWAGFQLQGEWK